MDLISANNFVECPFIIVTFGEYTFGSYETSGNTRRLGRTMKVTYPNMVKSLEVTKINGQVNTYTLKLVYAITENDDPNMMEKVFSSVKDSREMTLSYGDWNNPSSIYRKETALITSVKSNFSISASNIEYVVSGVSNSIALNSQVYDFPARQAKPSDVIKEMLDTPAYGLLDTFTGMANRSVVNINNLIASNDKEVTIEPQSMGTMDYLKYLVEHMTSNSDVNEGNVKQSIYQLCVVDNSTNDMGGPYFQVRNVDSRFNIKTTESGWEVDVGYPGKNFVTGFELENDEAWSILYGYTGQIEQSKYVYRIDNDGNIVTEESPSIMRTKISKRVTEPALTWWSQMTQFPITAKLTMKGLIRPTILMDYVKLNVILYGKRHIASGTYVITKQVDNVSSSGYRTTLSLLRVGADT